MTELKHIGIIHTPFKTKEGMPVQPCGAAGVAGRIEIFDQFAAGLKDLDSFSHIILLYQFHLSDGYDLTLTPFLDDRPHGLFATRAPRRPNPIGLSIVELNKIEGHIVHVSNIDVVDKTPLLDIKPYVPAFDQQHNATSGWLDDAGQDVTDYLSDGRFSK